MNPRTVRPCGFRGRARAGAVIVLAALLALGCGGNEGSRPKPAPLPSSNSSNSTSRVSSDSSAGPRSAGGETDTPAFTPASTTGNAAGAAGGTTVIGAEGCGRVAAADAVVDHSAKRRIVVLGSSTAAGANAKDPENAWVARYTKHVTAEFPNFVIENLAVGGFTTYRIQPTGYVPPAGRPTPKPERNITAALTRAPDAIIVNLPSNDQADGFTLAEQKDNYERVARLAREAGVLLWVTTTQPRNFTEPAQLQELMDARDAIKARFAPHAIDFWTNIANPDGTIKATYSSGDGVHLNDAGHGVLAELVISCAIPRVILTSKP